MSDHKARRKHGGKLSDIGLCNNFLYLTPKVKATEGKINK